MNRRAPFGEYIAQYYGVQFFKGQHVICGDDDDKRELGVVVAADNYVHVRIEGRKHAVPYHPSDVQPAPRGVA